jgi:SAM-dependent methyltransferase
MSEAQPDQSAFRARDVFAAGLFPICPATHDLGIRRLFDLATLLLLLDCRPGDLVLDLGAGPGFSSEMLARLGYDVIAVDPDRVGLDHNRRRVSWDPTRIEGNVQVAQGLAEQLPFRDACFDGVLGRIADVRGVRRDFDPIALGRQAADAWRLRHGRLQAHRCRWTDDQRHARPHVSFSRCTAWTGDHRPNVDRHAGTCAARTIRAALRPGR